MLTTPRLEEFLAAWPTLTIGLIGDLFLDRYLDIDPELAELSIETGLEAYQVTRIRNSPGALGTVMNNLTAIGVGRLAPVTVLGDDGQAYDLLQCLARMPVDTTHVLRDAERTTPTYTKPMRRDATGEWRELNRLDLRNRRPLSAATEQAVMTAVEQVWTATDGLIVLDQVNEEGWGVVTPRVRDYLAELAARHPEKLMFVDSRAHVARFTRGVLKPNLGECLAAVGQPATSDEGRAWAAASELARRGGQALFCTLGESGMLVVSPRGETTHVPGFPATGPIDVVGAGDSATSGIVASLLAGGSPVEAAAVGNLIASITVQQLGTTGTATPAQIRARWCEVTAG